MFRTIQTGGWLSGIVCVLLSTAATAELTPAEWFETIHLSYRETIDDWAARTPVFPNHIRKKLLGLDTMSTGS